MFAARFLYNMIAIELIMLRKSFFKRLFASLVPFSLQAFVLLFLLPQIGLSREYTTLVMISRLFTTEAMGAMAGVLSGLGSGGALNFVATTPVSVPLMLTGYTLAFTFKVLVLSLPIIPLAALFLYGTIQFSFALLFKFLFTVLVIRFFDSILGITSAGWTAGTWDFSTFARFINPLAFIAMFAPKWPMIAAKYPKAGWLFLLNPLLYLHEMGRSVVLGKSGFIPYSVCLGVLLGLIGLLIWIASTRLKSRFDLV
ncbi:hypothetical protein KAU11_05475 [Candidatus Babeliales bacterium]|nr:hypothetical protein [Candidatus Babeliales bacterium]